MRARFRPFLLLLLTLTLPLQALASASMLGCAFTHPGAALDAVAADAMTACHTEAPAAPAPEQHDCKQCAACYLASAMPIPALDAGLAVPLPAAHPPTAAARFSGFIPDKPERPPRQRLA